MKKQTKSNPRTSLQSLGIIFLILFGMAFSCGDDPNPSPPTNNGKIITERNNSGGSCSTDAEFRNILKRDLLKLLTTRDDIKQTEISIKSVNVKSPITFSPVYNSKVVDIYPAYPVTVNWFSREFRFGKITESDYQGSSYYCYKNPEDYASKFTPEDDRFPKNACVCILQAPTNPKWRDCPYDEDEPNKTCSGN